MTKPIIRTAADFLKVNGFQDAVNHEAQPLKKIVTHYYLDAEYHCGLRSCRTRHRDGYLVELENGGFTNIGHICGEKYGAKFTLEEARYADLELRPVAISHIQDVAKKIEANRSRINELAQQADRLSRCAQTLKLNYPRLYQDLNRRAHSSDDRVMEQIERTAREIDDLHALTPGSSREQHRYRSEFKGVLPGVQVLARNLREEIVIDFTTPAENLRHIDLGATKTKQLLELEGWALSFDDKLKKAEDLVNAGLKLYTPDAFKLMAMIAIASNERVSIAKMTMEALLKADTTLTEEKNKAPVAIVFKSKKLQDLERKAKALQERYKR